MSERADQSGDEVPQKDWIENILESLEMVQWDRFVRAQDDGLGVYFDIYGWIDREEDAYKDFILLRVFPETDDNLRMFTTSSDRYHDEINEILFGDGGATNHCQRVEHTFEVPNVVEIDEPELATDGGEEVEAATDREKVEMSDTTCPACGSTDVYGVYGGDAPAKVECRNCGHYGGSWE